MTARSYGIIGYGHFGAFLARSFVGRGEVLIFDADADRMERVVEGAQAAAFAEAAGCDVVVVAVPFSALENVLFALAPYLRPETVVLDVVSTKERATELLRTALDPHENILATHPLFGPPSMMHIERGQNFVVTYQQGDAAAAFREVLENDFGLEIIEIDPAEHDRAMAYMQALPFFIARALDEIGFLDQAHPELALPSFEKLSAIAAIELHHTPEMFETSQVSNPYAAEARRRLLAALQSLDAELP